MDSAAVIYKWREVISDNSEISSFCGQKRDAR